MNENGKDKAKTGRGRRAAGQDQGRGPEPERDHGHPHGHERRPDPEHPHRHPGESGGAFEGAGGSAILTVRAGSGLSGDMLLAGLAALAGLTPEELNALVDELRLPALAGCLTLEPRSVNHIAGVGCRINLPREHAHRTLTDIAALIRDSDMPERAKRLSEAAFGILAEAEAAVHGVTPGQVTFHEVGALDSILDTCLTCRIFVLLNPARFVCSPLPLADGAIACAHGQVPSPAPAVLRLLRGVPVRAFQGQGETVTPTALSLLKALDADFGGWPSMIVSRTVISYGGKVFPDAPNGALWALGRTSPAS